MLFSIFSVQGFATQKGKDAYADVGKATDTEQRETVFLSDEPAESSPETPERYEGFFCVAEIPERLARHFGWEHRRLINETYGREPVR